jgi:hypothetical protein
LPADIYSYVFLFFLPEAYEAGSMLLQEACQATFTAQMNVGHCFQRLFQYRLAADAFIAAADKGTTGVSLDQKFAATAAAAKAYLRGGDVKSALLLLQGMAPICRIPDQVYSKSVTETKFGGLLAAVQILTALGQKLEKGNPAEDNLRTAFCRLEAAAAVDAMTQVDGAAADTVTMSWLALRAQVFFCGGTTNFKFSNRRNVSALSNAAVLVAMAAANAPALDPAAWAQLDDKASLHRLLMASSKERASGIIDGWPETFVLPEDVAAARAADAKVNAVQSAALLLAPLAVSTINDKFPRHPRWVVKAAAGWGGHGSAVLDRLPSPNEIEFPLASAEATSTEARLKLEWIMQRYVRAARGFALYS